MDKEPSEPMEHNGSIMPDALQAIVKKEQTEEDIVKHDNTVSTNESSVTSSVSSALTSSPEENGCTQPASTPKSKASAKRPARVRSAVPKEEWLKPFELGWRREVVQRNVSNDTSGSSKGPSYDVYYFSPDNKKMRSNPQIASYLAQTNSSLTTDCFTFAKEQIHKEPFEIMRTAGQSKKFTDKTLVTKPGETTPTPSRAISSKTWTPGPALSSKTSTPVATISSKQTTSSAIPVNANQDPGEASKAIADKTPLSGTNGQDVNSSSKNKRSTGKRRLTNIGDAPDPKRPRILDSGPDHMTVDRRQRLCNLSCPGREDLPPCLPCQICMCMFHPECVGRPSRETDFTCMACIDYQGINMEPNNNQSKKMTNGLPSLMPQKRVSGSNLSRTPPPLLLGTRKISNLGQALHAAPAITFLSTGLSTNAVTVGNSNIISMTAGNSNLAGYGPSNVISNHVSQQFYACLEAVSQKKQTMTMTLEPGRVLDLTKPVILNANNKQYVIPRGFVKQTQNNAGAACAQVRNSIGAISFSPQQMAPVTLGTSHIQTSTHLDNLHVVQPVEDANRPLSKRKRFVDTPAWKNAFCHVNRFNVGFDALLYIFRFLSVPDLLRAVQVCRSWNKISSQPCLWRVVRLKNCNVTDWAMAAKRFRQSNTWVLDMRYSKNTVSNSKFVKSLQDLPSLIRVDFAPSPFEVIQSVAGNLSHLYGLTAEVLLEDVSSQQPSLNKVHVDMTVFVKMKNLEVLRLRSLNGMTVTSEINLLGQIKTLKSLSLTSLHRVPGKDLCFIDSLDKLEHLELGECYQWNNEIYEQLARLQNLKTLRLECGGGGGGQEGNDEPAPGLGMALLKMTSLRHLELIKYTIDESLSLALPKLVHLEAFHIWSEYPSDNLKKAQLNTCIIATMSKMSFLRQLDWGILMPTNSSTNLPQQNSILIMSAGSESKPSCTDTTSITISNVRNQLTHDLPDTKVRLFTVPII